MNEQKFSPSEKINMNDLKYNPIEEKNYMNDLKITLNTIKKLMAEKNYKRFDFISLVSPFVNSNISFDYVTLKDNKVDVFFLCHDTDKHISSENIQLNDNDLLYIYNMIYMTDINSKHD